MLEQRRGSDGARKGDQIRYDVVDRSDEAPVDDVGPGHHETTRERDGEEELDHGPQSLLPRKPNGLWGQRASLTQAAGEEGVADRGSAFGTPDERGVAPDSLGVGWRPRVEAILQVTPSGPWGKDVHPNMPVSLDELLTDLRECFRSGATGVHLHARDPSGAETLEPSTVNDTCRQVREVAIETGVTVEIGLTTGEWIVPELAQRIAMIREWEGVDCATVNLSERGFEDVMRAMLDVKIGIDVGLWAPVEIDRLVRSELLPQAQRISIELDPGEPYFLQGNPADLAQQVNDALDDAGATCPRLTHGMNDWTWSLVADAFRRGHDTRVGFEDSVLLPDGTRAESNAQLVEAALALQASGFTGIAT